MNLYTAFLALNILFLLGTCVWFRFDHASNRDRFAELTRGELVDDLQWQYSLRSNLLLWSCLLAAYVLYLGQEDGLLMIFAAFSMINVVTDSIYRYERAPGFSIVTRGHQIACGVIIVATIAQKYL